MTTKKLYVLFIALAVLVSYLIPFLAYSAEINRSGEIHTMSFPGTTPDSCLKVCKPAVEVITLTNGQKAYQHTTCGIETRTTGWGIAGFSGSTTTKKYCVIRHITFVNNREISRAEDKIEIGE